LWEYSEQTIADELDTDELNDDCFHD